ncbi:MAG: ribosome recycling factor [Rhodobacteraceae bacterium]|nr:MAG: ribosome recycling factor [Paracoccaceae bacterium]
MFLENEDFDLESLNKRMSGALNSLKNDFHGLRTGRASSAMLDTILVEVYGNHVPINQCATINVPEPRMVTVNVWDKANVALVEKAISSSGLGINPVSDGTVLRLPIPELNEERRKELSKLAGTYAEQARIAVRNVRRDGMDKIKKLKNDSMSDDDAKIWSDEIQELTNQTISMIDKSLEEKQSEIMQI